MSESAGTMQQERQSGECQRNAEDIQKVWEESKGNVVMAIAYTSIIPVHRLDCSVDHIRDKEKDSKKGNTASSLEEAIDCD